MVRVIRVTRLGHVALLLTLVLPALLVACGDENGGNAGGGGVLRWSNEGVADIATIDSPGLHSSNESMVSGLVFEGLMGLDSKLNVRSLGAAGLPEISADGRTYTFTIRNGLKWADGSPVTSEDFRFSLERALSKKFADGSAAYYLSNIVGADKWVKGDGVGLTGVTAPSPDKLVIKIVKPGIYFLDQLTFITGAVVPKKLIDQYGEDKWIEHAFGTGPFMVKEWKHNERIVLQANPNYWMGRPQLDSIDMPFISDPLAALASYQKGELDIMGTQQFPPGKVSEVQGKPDTKQAPQFFDAYIGFNNAKPPFDNVHLRRALALAVDKKMLAEKHLAGAVIQTDHIVPQGMPGFDEGLKPLAFNMSAARQELAQAGTGNVGKLSLTYTTGQADFDKVASAVKQDWKKNLGLDVQLNGEKQARFNDDLIAMANDPGKSDIQMYVSVWGADYPDPQNFLTQQLHTGVGNNNGHWSDPNFDRLTDQADIERDPGKRMDLYNQAEQIAIDKVGWLPLYNSKGTILMRPGVSGLLYTAQGLFADAWSKVTVK